MKLNRLEMAWKQWSSKQPYSVCYQTWNTNVWLVQKVQKLVEDDARRTSCLLAWPTARAATDTLRRWMWCFDVRNSLLCHAYQWDASHTSTALSRIHKGTVYEVGWISIQCGNVDIVQLMLCYVSIDFVGVACWLSCPRCWYVSAVYSNLLLMFEAHFAILSHWCLQ